MLGTRRVAVTAGELCACPEGDAARPATPTPDQPSPLVQEVISRAVETFGNLRLLQKFVKEGDARSKRDRSMARIDIQSIDMGPHTTVVIIADDICDRSRIASTKQLNRLNLVHVHGGVGLKSETTWALAAASGEEYRP